MGNQKWETRKWGNEAQLAETVEYSLVPRPFPPPVFDSLQFVKRPGNEAKWSAHVVHVQVMIS